MLVSSVSIARRRGDVGAAWRTRSCAMATPTVSPARRSRPPCRPGRLLQSRHVRGSSALPRTPDDGRPRRTPRSLTSWPSARSMTLRGFSDALPRHCVAVRRSSASFSRARARPRARTRWTAREDEILRLHAALNPAMLGALLGRTDRAIAARLRHLGLRAGRWRSPHHPTLSNGGLTPGERALVDREVRDRGPRALASLEGRLERPLRAIADVAQRQPRAQPRRQGDGARW
jgi:hypothetical protein